MNYTAQIDKSLFQIAQEINNSIRKFNLRSYCSLEQFPKLCGYKPEDEKFKKLIQTLIGAGFLSMETNQMGVIVRVNLSTEARIERLKQATKDLPYYMQQFTLYKPKGWEEEVIGYRITLDSASDALAYLESLKK